MGRRARHRGIVIAGGTALVFALAIVGALAGGDAESAGSVEPSAVALADIPGNYLVAYERAGARFGIDWASLAAIGKIECDHGRSTASGCAPGTVNAAGATGPMQFLGPTWAAGTALGEIPQPGPPTATTADGYATDGDGDGAADVWNRFDAVAGAARL